MKTFYNIPTAKWTCRNECHQKADDLNCKRNLSSKDKMFNGGALGNYSLAGFEMVSNILFYRRCQRHCHLNPPPPHSIGILDTCIKLGGSQFVYFISPIFLGWASLSKFSQHVEMVKGWPVILCSALKWSELPFIFQQQSSLQKYFVQKSYLGNLLHMIRWFWFFGTALEALILS